MDRRSPMTKKTKDFLSEPVGNKKVKEVPGIGIEPARNLSSMGYDNAKRLLGRYLDSDRREFTEFLQNNAGVRKQDADKVCEGLAAYERQYM